MTRTEPPDYDAIWRSIASSPFAQAYVSEVYWLAESVMRRAQEVLDDAKPLRDPTKTFIRVNPALMGTLRALVGDAVRLKTMLAERSRKAFKTDSQYQIHVRRARWLRDDLLKEVKLRAIMESGVRNTLEHFDEYLDDVALRCYHATIPRPTMIPFDMVVERRKSLTAIDPESYVEFLRVYLVTEKVFVNAGREISIRTLHDEARRITKRLTPMMLGADSEAPEEPYAAVMVLTDRSFPSVG